MSKRSSTKGTPIGVPPLATPRDLGRWLTRLENGQSLPETLTGKGEKAWRLGVTGSPGVGKSVLVDRLLAHFVGQGRRVAALLVDPSSPVTGGALLGDRIRVQSMKYGESAFVRSMATRGQLGGVAAKTKDMALLLGAAGYDPVIVESVGVGQNETGIRDVAHTVALVLGPGQGDEIQMLKAGLMEVADVFVVNKSDLPGAEQMAALLAEYVPPRPGGARPLVCLVSALSGTGIPELAESLESGRSLPNRVKP